MNVRFNYIYIKRLKLKKKYSFKNNIYIYQTVDNHIHPMNEMQIQKLHSNLNDCFDKVLFYNEIFILEQDFLLCI